MYFILGGISGQDGCVVTRTSDRNLAPISMQSTSRSWILKTNFDHWEAAPTWDDRRTPGIFCMKQKESTMNFASLYDVLSSRPVFNIATSYTSLMEVKTGKLETYVRFCEFPCSPGNGSPIPYGGFDGLWFFGILRFHKFGLYRQLRYEYGIWNGFHKTITVLWLTKAAKNFIEKKINILLSDCFVSV